MTHESNYGTTHTGTINSRLYREDRYVSKSDGTTHYNLTKVAHHTDSSRPVSTYMGPDRYSSKCPCCYLNQPHSVEYHQKAITA